MTPGSRQGVTGQNLLPQPSRPHLLLKTKHGASTRNYRRFTFGLPRSLKKVKQPKLREMDRTLGIALATSGESEDPVANSSHLDSTLLRFLLSHCELTIVWHCDNGLQEKNVQQTF